MQAAAAAMVEAYCNELNAMWKKEYLEKGLYLRPRFSPGYGDFPLSAQKQILDGLEAGKRIGITLTDDAVEVGDGGDRGEPGTGSLCDRGMRGVRKERMRVQKIS